MMENCGSSDLDPYLKSIPCDPTTKQPYLYVPDPANACKGYRILASLENTADPVIQELGCHSSCGCGYGEEYNYGSSAGIPLNPGTCTPAATPAGTAAPGSTATPAPTATPGGGNVIYVYACDPSGKCNEYEEGHEALAKCPVTFPSSEACVAAQCQLEINEGLRCHQ
jgi:hypothetical protein